MSEKESSVYTATFEVWRIKTDDHKSRLKEWFELSNRSQEITNFIWQHWLCWHVRNDSRRQIVKYLDNLAKWRDRKGKKADKPKCPVMAMGTAKNPGALNKLLYDGLCREFPMVHIRCLDLTRNAIGRLIRTRKAANGKLSGWMAILLCQESLPSTTRSQPIRFDKANSKLVSPLEKNDNWLVRLRIDRKPVKGKKMATSTVDEVELLTKRHGVRGHEAILERIALGEWTFKGSNLFYHKSRKKWFVAICYSRPRGLAQGKSDGSGGVAHLYPCRFVPWKFRSEGRKPWRLGVGERIVATVRKGLLLGRWNRQDCRYAGSQERGRGRGHILDWNWRHTQRWKQFVKNYNHQLTQDVVYRCIERGDHTLVYYQPCESARDSRCLVRAGKIPHRRDSTGWDWFQVATMLGYKCRDAGIHLIVKKVGKVGKAESLSEATQVA